MGKFLFEKHISKPGIYAIVNLADNHLYIGQAKSIKNRCYSHYYNLQKGTDENKQLLSDYNKGKKLLFFLLSYSKEELLNYHESLFCYIALQNGLLPKKNLINDNKNETIKLNEEKYFLDKYNVSLATFEKDYKNKNKIFQEAIKVRFGKKITELFESSIEDRLVIEKEYIQTNMNKIWSGSFDKDYLKTEYQLETISLSDIDFSRVIYTKIGEYLDQSLTEILSEKLIDINENGYCLWALNKLNAHFVREFCRDSEKEMYVIMRYTDAPSEVKKYIDFYKNYGFQDDFQVPEELFESIITSDKIRSSDIHDMILNNFDPIKELRIQLNDNKYVLPSELPHKETCKKTSKISYGKAFIIDKICILKENFDEDYFLSNYEYYCPSNKKATEALDSCKKQNDSGCLQIKKNINKKDFLECINQNNSNSRETNYLIARLKNPYFVELELDSEFTTRDR